MAPYTTLLLPALLELLQAYINKEYTNSVLWSEVVILLNDSFNVEDGESMSSG